MRRIFMNNNKRALASLSLGLLLAALLVPFIIAALGRADLAIGFGIVGCFLALILAAFSRSERLGRTVTVTVLLLFVLGLAATFVLSAIWRNHLVAREKLKSQRAEQEAVELMNQEKSVDSKR